MPIPSVFLSEYLINDTVTADDQSEVSLAGLANGQFTLVWRANDAATTDDDIRFSLRKGDGAAVSAAFNDDVLAADGTRDELSPATAALADGRMVHVWEELSPPGSIAGEIDVFAVVRNPDGSIFKSRFALSTQGVGAADDQTIAGVIGLANGNFLTAWKDTGAGEFLKARIFDIAGNQIGAEISVSTAAMTNAATNRLQMALLANGNVVLTWQEGASGVAEQQRYAIVTQNGAIVRPDSDVNPEDAVFENEVGSVIALADGNFVITFERDADANDIQGRLFSSSGAPIGGRFDISVGAANAGPRATALQDGRFMVVFDNGNDLFGQMMFADGTPDGARFTISNAAGAQFDPDVATLADGRVVVSWTSTQNGTSDIFAEIYDPREGNQILTGSSFNDDFFGTANNDAIYLGVGNDKADGRDGADYIQGGAGGDNLRGGNGVDLLFGEANNDSLLGDAGDDFLYGGLGDDSLDGGADNDTLYGDDGADFLTGGAGNNVLIGGAGDDGITSVGTADSIDGGAGDDTITLTSGTNFAAGGDGDDTVSGGTGADRIDGNAGVDTLSGNAGADTIYGGADGDTLNGNAGNDVLIGEAGVDTINGGPDQDSIDGGADGDILSGGAGLDFIQGGDGADLIFGDADADDLRGDAGTDSITGGGGGDTMTGGADADTFFFSSGSGVDVITDFQDNLDKINLAGYATANFANTIIAQSGANTVVAFAGAFVDQVILVNFTATNLTAGDFVF